MSGTVVSRTLNYEHNHGKFTLPSLWEHTCFWLKGVVPTIMKCTNNEQMMRMANEANRTLVSGWEIEINEGTLNATSCR